MLASKEVQEFPKILMRKRKFQNYPNEFSFYDYADMFLVTQLGIFQVKDGAFY